MRQLLTVSIFMYDVRCRHQKNIVTYKFDCSSLKQLERIIGWALLGSNRFCKLGSKVKWKFGRWIEGPLSRHLLRSDVPTIRSATLSTASAPPVMIFLRCEGDPEDKPYFKLISALSVIALSRLPLIITLSGFTSA